MTRNEKIQEILKKHGAEMTYEKYSYWDRQAYVCHPNTEDIFPLCHETYDGNSSSIRDYENCNNARFHRYINELEEWLLAIPKLEIFE